MTTPPTVTWQPVARPFKTVRLEVAQRGGEPGDVFRLVMNRPETLNALNFELFEDIPAAVLEAEKLGAGALIITGAGRGFCAGADLVTRASGPLDPAADPKERGKQSFARVIKLVRTINDAPMPVITAINGVAAGGGVGIALAGDIALMARSTRFVLTFVPKLGLVPDVSATWFMARTAGRARTIGASLTGDSITAGTAEQWGLIFRCVDDAELEAEALALAQRLADGPQTAVRATRRLVDAATATDIAAHLDMERDTQLDLIGSPDNVEGVLAFREKRPGNYRKNRIRQS